MEGIYMETVLMECKSNVVKGLEEELKEYNQVIQDEGPEAVEGGPLRYLLRRLLTTLVVENVGELNQRNLQEYIGKLEAMDDVTEVQDLVQHLAFKKCYASNLMKVHFVVKSEYKLRKTLCDSMKLLGGDHKRGRAPRGAIEDELAKWLQSFQQTYESLP